MKGLSRKQNCENFRGTGSGSSGNHDCNTSSVAGFEDAFTPGGRDGTGGPRDVVVVDPSGTDAAGKSDIATIGDSQEIRDDHVQPRTRNAMNQFKFTMRAHLRRAQEALLSHLTPGEGGE